MCVSKPRYDRAWGEHGDPLAASRLTEMLGDMYDESKRAASLHGHIRSRHELLGIMHEEWAEVCDVIHNNKTDDELRKELVQLGAMCLRAAYECGGLEGPKAKALGNELKKIVEEHNAINAS